MKYENFETARKLCERIQGLKSKLLHLNCHCYVEVLDSGGQQIISDRSIDGLVVTGLEPIAYNYVKSIETKLVEQVRELEKELEKL